MKVTLPRRMPYTEHDKERWTLEVGDSGDIRSPFEHDRARIIHSAAFRRLQGKTQVFMAGEGDFFRTRLTHSLEVSQIAKTLALRLGVDTDLLEAAALLHDIGHPPFGHAGEKELKLLMALHGGFEANAQNIRIFTRLESKELSYRGLNLTRAVIDSQMKYKQPFSLGRQKFIYASDLDTVGWASDAACLAAGRTVREYKSFECQIMEWADDIAYAVHDLEDSIHAQYTTPSTLEPETRGAETAIAKVEGDFPNCDVRHIYQQLKDTIVGSEFSVWAPRNTFKQQKANRKRLTRHLIDRYVKAVCITEHDDVDGDPLSHRYAFDIAVDDAHRVEVELIKGVVMELVIRSPQVHTLEVKGRHIVRSLFQSFLNDDALLPNDWREYFEDYSKHRVVSDYISGMTDEYAQRAYAKLFLPNYGSIYEVF